ncbi:MAG TPA: acyl-CoA dehydrogenase family protein [Gemmatimonadales bacterium]|nr:acyl-CoA dehydrogenase family protein [Gemmatimonadales bacterium]
MTTTIEPRPTATPPKPAGETSAAPAAAPAQSVLTDALLGRCLERAPVYDRENRFFTEDFDELRDAGYLKIAVPVELGGRGLSLAQVLREQRRLAYFAPATALAVNMHVYWTGLVADLWRAGDRSLEWLLREAANGAVLAAGHAETGNDIPLLLSTTRAEPVKGGYRFHGRKSFGSLTPVWTYLGLHGMDTSEPGAPRIVHAFLPRDAAGYSIVDTWDVLGMRATRSDDTVLDGAFIPDRFVARVLPAGAAGVDPFILGIFAWGLLGFGNVYYGMAQRALDLTVDAMKRKRSLAVSRSMAYHPGVQQQVAEMALELEAIGPHLDRVAEDWAAGADFGAGWIVKIFAAKHHAVEGSWRVVDRALELAGGFGIFRKGPIEQLFRDARLGRIHPANSLLTHEIVAKLTLGINPDEQPRWG